MKKILILCVLLLLSSCSIDWNGEKDKKIAELEKQIQDDTFKKKQECLKYKDVIVDKISSQDNLLEIFYGNKYKSCYYIIEKINIKTYEVYDILSQKFLYNTHNYIDVENKIKELKGE